MIGLEITLLRPLWLILLPALAVVAWVFWHRRGALGDWSRAADPRLIQAMTRLGHVDGAVGRGRVVYLLLASLLIVILALTGPAIERRDTLSYRNLDGVMFVVDASDSMTEHPNWPELVAIGRFGIATLGTRPGGIILFAGDAYVATDMTIDHVQLGQTFSLIKSGSVPDPGSRPERGLNLAADRLNDAEVIAGDVVMLTDGAELGPAAILAAERIAALGGRLSVISVGEKTAELETLVTIGGGRIFGTRDVEAFGAYLKEDARTRLQQQEYPLLFWRDLGRYLLFLAMLPLVFLFRREA